MRTTLMFEEKSKKKKKKSKPLNSLHLPCPLTSDLSSSFLVSSYLHL